MFVQIFMTAVWSCHLWLAVHAAYCPRAGPHIERRPEMAEEKKSPDAAERSTPKTRAITVQLKELPEGPFPKYGRLHRAGAVS